MKRILIASCVAATCGVGLAAQAGTGTKPQSPTTTTQSPTSKPQTAAQDDKTAVVRGCLRAGDQSGTFVLANATATSGGTLKDTTVQLTGSPSGTNLKAHVGHTVEVTGMLAAGTSKSSSSAGAGTGTGTGTSTGKGAGTSGTGAGTSSTGAGSTSKSGTGSTAGASSATLTVKALKHVKESC